MKNVIHLTIEKETFPRTSVRVFKLMNKIIKNTDQCHKINEKHHEFNEFLHISSEIVHTF